ncbi:endonuclease/exonuclease/phosphatase family protein [Nonomuraea sp. SBT364]|uniref:endonuclease/exonuclease/phosphatase family protein n=1 Tax=Nonomuraea sp. SBT364 TaxID=1580530 RepID=UPI0007C70E10|nr:endonuclease/exonuclease/phosphatase family protein [Nonomuraea sp. SBT364]
MRKIWTRIGMVIATAALTVPATANASAAAASYTVWHWNVAGNTLNGGSTTSGMVQAAVGSIVARGANLASFNELCVNQYQALITGLRNAGWPADDGNFARFAVTYSARSGGPCGGRDFGNAIFSKQPLGAAERITLPDDGKTEQRKMLCAPLQARPRLRFCTTHTTYVDAYRASQLNAVLKELEDYHADGDTVVIAGDFNVHPDSARLNGYYSAGVSTANNGGNTGRYHELDDADPSKCPGYGELTVSVPDAKGPCGTGTKLDMIFARENKIVGSYSGDSLAPSTSCAGNAGDLCSDHRVVVGTATLS